MIFNSDPDYYVSLDDFNSVFKDYCKKTGVGKRFKLDPATCHDILARFNCSIVKGERFDPSKPDETEEKLDTMWVVGCTLEDQREGCDHILDRPTYQRSDASIAWKKLKLEGKSGTAAELAKAVAKAATETESARDGNSKPEKPVETARAAQAIVDAMAKTINKEQEQKGKTTSRRDKGVSNSTGADDKAVQMEEDRGEDEESKEIEKPLRVIAEEENAARKAASAPQKDVSKAPQAKSSSGKSGAVDKQKTNALIQSILRSVQPRSDANAEDEIAVNKRRSPFSSTRGMASMVEAY